MSSTLALDGPDWTVREALGLSWQWYVAGREDASHLGGPVPVLLDAEELRR